MIIDGLWSDRPFSFKGKHYQIDETTFLSRPVQQPRIPIWVARMWPARAPMRRAARSDGAFPIRSDMGFLSLAEVSAISGYVASHRAAGAPFDLVMGADLPEDAAAARDVIARFADAGVTWWIDSDPDPAEFRRRIRRGSVGA